MGLPLGDAALTTLLAIGYIESLDKNLNCENYCDDRNKDVIVGSLMVAAMATITYYGFRSAKQCKKYESFLYNAWNPRNKTVQPPPPTEKRQ